MQPPRRRSGRVDLRNAATIRVVVLNVTALLLTLTLTRIATLLVTDAEGAVFSSYIRRVTEPLVWPLHQISPMTSVAGGNVTLADLLLIPVFLIVGLLTAGVISGWNQAASPPPPHLRTRR